MSLEPTAGDWQPSATLDTLRWRSCLLQELRRFFIAQGYWEVETPIISQDTCVDAWLNPLTIAGTPLRYLQTSPEFGMKRLLAAGADAIFQVTRSFREGEVGRRHNPEFTMVEWYRCGVTYRDQMQFTSRLVRTLWEAARDWGLRVPDWPHLHSEIPCWTYDAAFTRCLGKPVLQMADEELIHWAREVLRIHGGQELPTGIETQRDDLLNYLLALLVEPELARQGACFLCDFPASQAALARIREDSPPVAERFELYLGELEICNGYQELTCAAELRRRQKVQNQRRVAAGQQPLPTEHRLLRAMDAGFPASSGVALGFDRLVMWLLQRSTIAEVQAFPWDRA